MAPKEIVAAIEMQEQELIRIKGMTSIYWDDIHDRRTDIYIRTIASLLDSGRQFILMDPSTSDSKILKVLLKLPRLR